MNKRQKVGKEEKFEVVAREGDISLSDLEDKTTVSDDGAESMIKQPLGETKRLGCLG